MTRQLTEAEQQHLHRGLKPRCSDCHEEIDIVDGAVFNRPGQTLILAHNEDVVVCPDSTIEWFTP